MAKKRKNEKVSLSVAAKAGLGLAAGLAATTVSVACLTFFYMKNLMGIEYIGDEDVYEDED